MNWLDYIVVGIVIIVGLVIFYKALKEPLDLLGGLIKKAFSGIKESMASKTEEAYETIYYG
jgi:hypothetical protein